MFAKRDEDLRKLALEAQHNGFVHIGSTASQQAPFYVYLKVLLGHFQIILQFPLVLSIEFPEAFQAVLDVLQAVEF